MRGSRWSILPRGGFCLLIILATLGAIVVFGSPLGQQALKQTEQIVNAQDHTIYNTSAGPAPTIADGNVAYTVFIGGTKTTWSLHEPLGNKKYWDQFDNKNIVHDGTTYLFLYVDKTGSTLFVALA